MIIGEPRRDLAGGIQVLRATVTWEDSDIGPKELSFELPDDGRGEGEVEADPFLIGCLPVAVRHQERRIRIAASACPLLCDGLATAASWLGQWNPAYARRPAIEPASGRRPPPPEKGSAACPFSGGIDSTFGLLHNHRIFAREDPSFIARAYLVYGYDMGKRPKKAEDEAFARAVSHARTITDALGASLVPIRTNLRHLDSDSNFWTYEFHGAALAAAGYAATTGPTTIFVAATNDVRHMIRLGSHPLLDPNFGSQRVRIIHDATRFSRLDKIRVLSQRPDLLRHVRVCTANAPGALNCGRCEKCLRSKLELLALGIDRFEAFADETLSADLVDREVNIVQDYHASCYTDIVGLVRERGRPDLASAIERRVAAYRAGPSCAP